ncbi:MAG: M56 family metallopeptidase, partial [Oscillospiraceae bacterium]|nr:M56 family metallopeptidase [Oscillospiraceae bacterium]
MSLLQMSFSGAVLILVIAVIRMIAIHRLPKKTFLALWIIALARLLLPFSVPSPFSVYSLVRENKSDLQISDTLVRENESDLQISDTIAYEARQPVYREAAEEIQTGHVVSDTPQTLQAEPSEALPSAPLPSESARTPSVSIWTILWLIGMLIPAGSFSVSYLRCRREFRTSLPIENDTITEWLEGHRLKRKIEIRQFSGIMTPMTYGLFYPVILLPENTDFENKQQLQYILYHEYVHIRNYDAALKLLAAAALCIHWFNPMVWVMYILFNRDIELTCDESVVHNFGRENRSAYAKMLISMEERKSRFSPFFNNFSKTAIEERIKSIMKTKKTSVLALILSVVVVTGTAGCFATSVQENKNNTEQTESDRDVEAANDPSASAEWSFEKICSLIKIDGTPLKFPCTFEEISSINNITIEDPNDGLGFYDIYYNGTNVGLISFDKDTGTSRFISLYYYDDEAEENIDGLTFAGYSAEQETEINNFMDENFNISYDRSDLSAEDFYRKVYEFEQGNQKMEFTIDFDDSKLYLIRIRLDEIEPLSESAETKQTETRQDV